MLSDGGAGSLYLLTIQYENKTQNKFPLCPRSQSQPEDPMEAPAVPCQMEQGWPFKGAPCLASETWDSIINGLYR